MADNGRSWLGDMGLRIADRFVAGNNYDRSSGQWRATPGQYIAGIGSKALGLVNPALGQVANFAANRYYNGQNQGQPYSG